MRHKLLENQEEGAYDPVSNGDVVIWFMNGGTIASTGDLGVVASGWSLAGVVGN